MEQVPLGGLFAAGHVSAIVVVLVVTGGIAVVYGVLELVGVAPRRNVIGGRKLDRRLQSLVIVLIGMAMVVVGLALR